MESQLINYAQQAVDELKEGKKQLFNETSTNYFFSKHKIVGTRNFRVILLIVFRGEHPAVIPIKLSCENALDKSLFEEIKKQIKNFSYGDEFPNYFSITELLDYDGEVRQWFYGFEAELVCNNCSRVVVLKKSHFDKFSERLGCKTEDINPNSLKTFAEKQNLVCSECKSKDIKINLN